MIFNDLYSLYLGKYKSKFYEKHLMGKENDVFYKTVLNHYRKLEIEIFYFCDNTERFLDILFNGKFIIDEYGEKYLMKMIFDIYSGEQYYKKLKNYLSRALEESVTREDITKIIKERGNVFDMIINYIKNDVDIKLNKIRKTPVKELRNSYYELIAETWYKSDMNSFKCKMDDIYTDLFDLESTHNSNMKILKHIKFFTNEYFRSDRKLISYYSYGENYGKSKDEEERDKLPFYYKNEESLFNDIFSYMKEEMINENKENFVKIKDNKKGFEAIIKSLKNKIFKEEE